MDILVVDDNIEAAELLQELLCMDGHTVRTAATGAQALELVRAQPAQVFLLDQNLPDMTGADLVPQLRALQAAHQAGPAVAVAVTGMVSGGHTSGDARWKNFDHVMGKPIDFDALDSLLARCAETIRT